MRIKLIFAIAVSGMLLCSCNGNKTADEGQGIAVKVLKVSSVGGADGVVYSGTIEETTGTVLSFSSTGNIATMNVREGMMVSKGQVLATLDGKNQENLLTSARSATDIARQTLAQVEDTYERMRVLHEAGSLSEVQWIEAETRLSQAKASVQAAEAQQAIAEKGASDTNLTAPFSGFVASKMADLGQQVAPGTPIAKLVDIDRVKAKFSVGESEVSSLSVGQSMSVRITTLNHAVFEGKITEKSVSADPISRSYDVTVSLDNKAHDILPGMLCEVFANDTLNGGQITVPSQVVLIDETNRRYVWCLNSGKATKKYVTVGRNVGDNVIITNGIAEGDNVITDGRQKVWEGATCKAE